MNLQNAILKASREMEVYWRKLCIDGDAGVIERFKARGFKSFSQKQGQIITFSLIFPAVVCILACQ